MVTLPQTCMQKDFLCLTISLVAGERPTLPKLLRFPGRSESEKINIPRQIGTKYKQFGVLLLNDETGAEVDATVTQYRDNAEQINLEIFTLWIGGKGKPLRWDTLICTLKEIELNTLASDIQNICKLYGWIAF